MKFKRILWVGSLIILFCLLSLKTENLFPQTRDQESFSYFIDPSLWNAIAQEYSSELAIGHISELAKYDRVAGGSPGYNEALNYVKRAVESLGIYEVEVDDHPADGELTYLKWRSMPGWEIREAELWLETTGELLAKYSAIPTSVFEYSNGANVSAEAVFVGRGAREEDYQGIDVKGKIVVATGDGDRVHQEAVIKRGALGVVVGTSTTDLERTKYSGLVQLYRLKNNKTLRKQTTFGFSLSAVQFEKIIRQFEQGKKVRLKAAVDARQYDSQSKTLVAVWRGKTYPEKEIILSAHLDHYSPGANDNASGSALLIEIARILNALQQKGILDRPKRTIRFLWVEEMHGFAGYLAKDTAIGERGIAGINLDMVGEDSAKTQSLLTLVRTPFSNPSFIGDHIEGMIRLVDRSSPLVSSSTSLPFSYRISGFKGGSDHFMLSDTTIGVPTVNIGHDGDIFHHTNLDNLDKIDPDKLKSVGMIALGALLFAANAEEAESLRLTAEVGAQGLKRMAESLKKNMEELYGLSCDDQPSLSLAKSLKETQIFTDILAKVEIGALKSVEKLSSAPRVQKFTAYWADILKSSALQNSQNLDNYFKLLCDLKGLKPPAFALSKEEEEMKKIVPRRLFRGPLSQFFFEDLLGKGIAWYEDYGRKDRELINRQAEILNFMDGKKSLLEIYYAVSAEFGRSDISFYKKFVSDLKQGGLVDY